MSRPAKFDVMRHNRRALARAINTAALRAEAIACGCDEDSMLDHIEAEAKRRVLPDQPLRPTWLRDLVQRARGAT